MKYLLLFPIAILLNYSASAQRDDVYYLQKQLKKHKKGFGYFEKYEETIPVVSPKKKAFILANGSEVSFLKKDNMPCIKPDMSQFNMPCIKPKKQTYNMPVLDETNKDVMHRIINFQDGKIVRDRLTK